MKIYTIFRIFTLSLLCFITINCSNEKNETVEKKSLQNLKISEVTFILPKNLKNTNISTDEYLNYAYFDGIPVNVFLTNNNIDKNLFINLIDGKLTNLDSNISNGLNFKAKPTLQEIRDAMIKECEDGYCCGLDTLCVAAVKLAYFIKVQTQ
jgi:hypothetical protein